jgi:hypothetical protein
MFRHKHGLNLPTEFADPWGNAAFEKSCFLTKDTSLSMKYSIEKMIDCMLLSEWHQLKMGVRKKVNYPK